MSVLIGITTFLILVFVIQRFTTRSYFPLNWVEVALAFGFKVLMGCCYGYIFLHFYDGDDTWILHQTSLTETKMLLTNPRQFFWEYTPGTAIRNGDSFYQIISLYLTDLEYCLMVKTLGIFNLISQGSYYVNVVLLNFIFFWGHYWLFLLFAKEFPFKRKLLFLVIFFFPPAAFWLSGIRSDGWLFLFVVLAWLSFYKILRGNPWALVLLCTGFLGIAMFRFSIMPLALVAIAGCYWAGRFRQIGYSYLIVYAIAIGLFFASPAVSPSLSGPALVAKRQAEFAQLRGTAFALDTLRATASGFASALPQAAANTFLRPAPWEWEGLLQLMAALQILFFWLLLASLFFRRESLRQLIRNPIMVAILCFSVSVYLSIGYVVPFPGAIVRYKAIPELMIITSLIIFWRPSIRK